MKLIAEVTDVVRSVMCNCGDPDCFNEISRERMDEIALAIQNAVASKCAEIAEHERGKFLEHRMGNHAYGAEAVVLRFREAFSLPLKEESKTDGGKGGKL